MVLLLKLFLSIVYPSFEKIDHLYHLWTLSGGGTVFIACFIVSTVLGGTIMALGLTGVDFVGAVLVQVTGRRAVRANCDGG